MAGYQESCIWEMRSKFNFFFFPILNCIFWENAKKKKNVWREKSWKHGFKLYLVPRKLDREKLLLFSGLPVYQLTSVLPPWSEYPCCHLPILHLCQSPVHKLSWIWPLSSRELASWHRQEANLFLRRQCSSGLQDLQIWMDSFPPFTVYIGAQQSPVMCKYS